MLNRTIRGIAALCLGCLPFAALADGHTDEVYGQKGYVGEKGYVGDVEAPVVGAVRVKTHYVKRVRAVEVLPVPPCPHDYTGMYRGTLYCVNGRLVP